MTKNHAAYIFVLLSIIAGFITCRADEAPRHEFRLVIDPGHGGKDLGATDNGAREKDVNLGVALQLQKLVDKKLKDAKVIMTRDDDSYLTLQQRADIANKAKGDLFISIHTNSVDKSNRNRKTVAGASVYALGLHKDDNNMQVAMRENSVIELENNFEQKYSGFDPQKDESYIIFEMAQKKNLSQSIRFAEEAHRQLTASGRKARGVHQAGFWVLWATSMPAVLVELDFICNPTSAAYLTSKKGQKELAEAIFLAVEKFSDNLRKPGSTAWQHDTGTESVDAEEARTLPLVAARTSVRKTDTAPAATSGTVTATKRRRRSEAARISSDNRNVETENIPQHSQNERLAKTVEVTPEQPSATPDSETLPADTKGKKKKDKKNKEEAKKKNDTKKTKQKTVSHNAKREKFVTIYKIQILTSADLLKTDNPRFQGLSPVTVYRDGNRYKYYYGESEEKSVIDNMLKDVRKKIPDAFVVSSLKSANAK